MARSRPRHPMPTWGWAYAGFLAGMVSLPLGHAFVGTREPGRMPLVLAVGVVGIVPIGCRLRHSGLRYYLAGVGVAVGFWLGITGYVLTH